MRIELVDEVHLEALLAIEHWGVRETWATFRTETRPLEALRDEWRERRERFPWLAALEEGAVVGFARGGPHDGRCACAWTVETSVYVRPEAQGRGVGRALYARLLPLLERQRFQVVRAGVAQPNPASDALHERCGFRRVGTFRRGAHKLGAWRDVTWFELELGRDGGPPAPLRTVAEALGGASP